MENVRGYSKSYYISAVAGIILGLAMLVWPETSMQTFCYTLGAVAVIFGLVKIVMYFTKDRMENLMQPDLVVGITATAFGAFVLLKSEFVLSILPFFTGVFLLIGAILKLQAALDLKRLEFRAWWVVLIISIAMFALGGLLVANPFDAARVVVILIGAGLLADGATNLADMFLITSLYKKARNKPKEKNVAVHVVDAEEAEEITKEPSAPANTAKTSFLPSVRRKSREKA
ncbi:MAG: DUF308 domain-containing protein [Eubacteriales bacterium]|nr:DUF308 domain-containing protein [Eubacteriales bacterium]